MTLDNLVGKTLEPITPDPAAIRRLREAAARSLGDAQLPGLSQEGRFDQAYKAIIQTANMALQANGYRTLTSKPGHHQTMIQTLTQTIGLEPATMVVLDGLRKQRNVIDYSGDLVSAAMADEAVRQARALLERAERWLRENRPGLAGGAP